MTTAMGDLEFLDLCKTGSCQEITVAIEAGANVNAKDNGGRTALMYAAEFNNNSKTIETLMRYGADVNVKDNDDKTVLMHYVMGLKTTKADQKDLFFENIFRALVDTSVELRATDRDGHWVGDYLMKIPNLFYQKRGIDIILQVENMRHFAVFTPRESFSSL